MVIIFSKIAGITGVWISYPVSNAVSVIITVVLVLRELKIIRKDIIEQPAAELQ